MKLLMMLFLVMGSWQVISAQSITLKELKKQAILNHYGIRSQENRILIEKYREELLKSSFWPSLGVELGENRLWSKGVQDKDDIMAIYGNLNLFRGFRDRDSLKTQKIKTLISKSELRQAKFELGLEIERMYYIYFYLKVQKKIVSEALERNTYHIKMIKKRLAASLITKADFLEFQLEGEKLKSQKESLEKKSRELLWQIIKVSFLSPDKKYKLIGHFPHLVFQGSEGELRENILLSEPLKRLEMKKKISMFNQRRERSNWYPSVNLEARYGRLDEQETGVSNSQTATSISLIAKWEFFSGFKTQNSLRLRKALVRQASLEAKQREFTGVVQGKSLLEALKILEKRIEQEEKNARLAKKLYDRTLREYQRGIKDSGALLASDNNLTSIKFSIYRLKSEYIHNKLVLEKTVGKSLPFKEIKHKEVI